MAVENGFVPTPPAVADYAASLVFGVTRPSEVEDGGRLLLPGLGTGNLYDGVQRYCTEGESWCSPSFDYPTPRCVGVESDQQRIDEFHEQHPGAEIEVVEGDFLSDPPAGEFDWVLANPPFTRYKNLPEVKRDQYREAFDLASGQFPLHVPFFEQSMRSLKEGGELVFILPFSVFSASSLEPFREALRVHELGPICYLPAQAFDVKVETVLLGLTKQAEGSWHTLWLEQLYGYEVRPILEQLGVDDIEDAVEAYYDEFEWHHEFVRSREAATTPPARERARRRSRLPSGHAIATGGGRD